MAKPDPEAIIRNVHMAIDASTAPLHARIIELEEEVDRLTVRCSLAEGLLQDALKQAAKNLPKICPACNDVPCTCRGNAHEEYR